ncbi:FkbM family methyltransferase [Flavobacterium sp. AS60]|uniref:FkbM family methyltransferase n=1 Tax=Flavobacterium anseongense TaxID=2910677 RepID=UPI001F015A00|nr:FkbM family methyltransferase [Flavobacterium sp. AS60]MCF6129923.1 FkbM family methyltransferase [Flavobacterium sp. AS60]
MQKLFHLHRLDAANRNLVLKYLFKRVVGMKTTEQERLVNEYYFHLISFNGFFKTENEKEYISNYPNFGVTIKLRKRPSSDLNVFAQIYQYDEYKPLVAVFKKNFPDDLSLNIIDAGCNIGLTSVYLSKYFPNSNFIIIEPDSSNFESIGDNFEMNDITTAIKIKGGLWSKNTNLKLVNDFRDQNDWSYRVEETNEETDLKAYSIPFLMKEYNFDVVDILKIDIEGSEKELFSNGDISFLEKTKCVAIEIHDEFDCREMIYAILKKYNFEYFETGDLTIGINQNLIKDGN